MHLLHRTAPLRWCVRKREGEGYGGVGVEESRFVLLSFCLYHCISSEAVGTLLALCFARHSAGHAGLIGAFDSKGR